MFTWKINQKIKLEIEKREYDLNYRGERFEKDIINVSTFYGI